MKMKKLKSSNQLLLLSSDFEKSLVENNGTNSNEKINIIIGVDEVSRGNFAGPVFTSACILPKGWEQDNILKNIRDSKKLNENKRNTIYKQLIQHPDIIYDVQPISNTVIDQLNILQATMLGMRKCIQNVVNKIIHIQNQKQQINASKLDINITILIDGNKKPSKFDFDESFHTCTFECKTIVKGDLKCPSIAAASIIAKETQIEYMKQIHEQYPQYGFDKHHAYGTKEHLANLEKYGPCPLHRFSYKPVKDALQRLSN